MLKLHTLEFPLADSIAHKTPDEVGEVFPKRIVKHDTINGYHTYRVTIGRSSPEFGLFFPSVSDATKVAMHALFELDIVMVLITDWYPTGINVSFDEFHPRIRRGLPYVPDQQWEIETKFTRRPGL